MRVKMYGILKNFISRKKFRSLDEARRKLTVYNMGGVITDDEYLKLIEFVNGVYAESEA